MTITDNRTRWLALIVLCLGTLMIVLDTTIVNVALPSIRTDLHFSQTSLAWVVNAYLLTFGGFLLLGGRLGDLYGPRRLFLSGITLFTVASLCCGLANTQGLLVAARAVQGLGGAVASAVSLALTMTLFTEPAERAKAMGIFGFVASGGGAIGVLLGGVLTNSLDWHWIFLVNLPIGVLVVLLSLRLLPGGRAEHANRRLDVAGAVTVTAALMLAVYAIVNGNTAGWTSAQTLGLGLAGLAGLSAFAALELHTPKPLLNLSRLGERGVGGGFVMMLAASAVLFGSFLLTSIYLQEVLGTGALETGLAFLPMAVIIGLGAHLGSHLVGHAGLRIAMAAAFALTAAGMLLLAGVDGDGSYVGDVLPGMLVAGLGLGIALVSVALSVLTGADDDEAGMLSGLNTTGHEIGGSLGVAVLVTIATGAISTAPSASTAGLASGLGDAFLVSGAIAAVAGVVALFVLPSAASFLPKLRLAPRVAIH
jgi:EmrB/QacA subfamily drug resistance transporter